MCIQWPIINNQFIIILMLSFGALFYTTPHQNFRSGQFLVWITLVKITYPHMAQENKNVANNVCEVLLVMPKGQKTKVF